MKIVIYNSANIKIYEREMHYDEIMIQRALIDIARMNLVDIGDTIAIEEE